MNSVARSSTNLPLARGARWDVRALRARLSPSDLVARPSPVRAGALSAQDINISCARRDRTSDLLDHEIGDRDARGRLPGRAAVLVVLLNDDAVLGDPAERDVRVRDVGDRARRAVHRLDAHAVLRVADLRVRDHHALHRVVVAPAHRPDAEAVPARARAPREQDVRARVDGEAVVLVLDVGADDADAVRGADVEGVGVVAARVGVAVRVVDGDVLEGQVRGAVDGEALDRRVLHVEARDGRRDHLVRVEELGLLHPAVAALAVPPLRAPPVDHVPRGPLDRDARARDADERALPRLVREGRRALEGHGRPLLERRQVERLARRHRDPLQHDVGAGRLARRRGRSRRERAAGALLERRADCSSRGCNSPAAEPQNGESSCGTHGECDGIRVK